MLGSIFSNRTTLGVVFTQIFRDFAEAFTDLARIFWNFVRIFTKSKLIVMRLHPVPPPYPTPLIRPERNAQQQSSNSLSTYYT